MKNGFGKILIIFTLAWILLIVGVVFGYLYASKSTKSVSGAGVFEALPKSEQSKYVKKTDIPKFLDYLKIEKEDIVPIDAPINGSEDELKAQIKTLREKNQALYLDNVNLTDKNWELAQNIQEEKQSIESEKQKIQAKNIANINEAEQQHYQNVNELTKRINELQQESIQSTREYESKIVALENNIDKLKNRLKQKEFEVNEEINAATKKERINSSTLAEKNRYLLEQVTTMKSKLQEVQNENSNKVQLKNNKIASLKESINKLEAKQNEMLSNHTKEILKKEQKNAQMLNELRKTIVDLQSTHKAELSDKNKKMFEQIEKQKRQIITLKNALAQKEEGAQKVTLESERSAKQTNELINSLKQKINNLTQANEAYELKIGDMEQKVRDISIQKENEYSENLKNMKKSLLGDISSADKTSRELERRILEAASIIDDLKTRNQKLTIEIDSFKNRQKYLISSKELKKKEDKNAENYKILNDKIVQLKLDKKNIYEEAKKKIELMQEVVKEKANQIAQEESKTKDEFASMSAKVKNLTKENTELKKFQSNNIAKIELKKANQNLDDALKMVDLLKKQNSELSKNKEQFQSKMTLLTKNDEKLSETLEKVASLESLNNELKKENESLKSANSNIKTTNQKDLVEFKDRFEKTNRELKDTLEELARLKTEKIEFSKTKTALQKENDLLKRAGEDGIQKYKTSYEKANSELDKTKTKLASVQKQIESLNKEKAELQAKNISAKSVNQNVLKEVKVRYNDAMKNIKELEGKLTAQSEKFANLQSAKKILDEKYALLEKKKSSKLDVFKTRFERANEDLKDSQDKIMSLRDEIIALENEKKNIEKSSKKILEDTKTDYQQKLVKFGKDYTSAQEKANKTIASLNEKIAKLKATATTSKSSPNTDELQTKLEITTNNLRNRVAEVMALKNEIETLKGNSKMPNISEFDNLKNQITELNLQKESLQKELEDAKKKQSLKVTIGGVANAPSKPSKLVLKDSIECDDLPVGRNNPTNKCITKVNAFLSKYGASNFYEVVPIVDDGGFASLKKVQRSKLKIPKREIKRLTRLSNLGLGKDRAAGGGKLIKARFGDLARISYAVENISKAKKRGFVIRVYE